MLEYTLHRYRILYNFITFSPQTRHLFSLVVFLKQKFELLFKLRNRYMPNNMMNTKLKKHSEICLSVCAVNIQYITYVCKIQRAKSRELYKMKWKKKKKTEQNHVTKINILLLLLAAIAAFILCERMLCCFRLSFDFLLFFSSFLFTIFKLLVVAVIVSFSLPIKCLFDGEQKKMLRLHYTYRWQ